MRLLVTRPEPEASHTATMLRQRGHAVLVQPLLRIEPLRDADLGQGPWAAVAMTSANAAEAIARHPAKAQLLALPVFTVGNRTREAALAAGFAQVESADGDVAALARLISSMLAGPNEPVIYLAGEDRAGDLEGRLGAQNIAVHTVVVYSAIAESRFTPEVDAALAAGALDGALHYSKRSAEAFVAAAMAAGRWQYAASLRHFCLSSAVAAPLAAAGAQHIRVAGRPDQSAIFELLNQA
jgi:uroporphyrinogen-III synthase